MTTKTPAKPAAPDDYVSYSYSAALGAAVPEIGALLKQAAAGKWDVQRFQDALQKTKWWAANSDTAKQMIALQKQDPAQYNQQYIAAERHVSQMAQSLGITITTDQIKQQATVDMWQGLDDATVQSQIAALYKTAPTNGSGGTAVSLNAQIKQLAASYGVPVTQTWLDGQVRQALTAGTGAEGATAALTQMAVSVYPALAAQLQAGQTTEDIAQPYIAAMSQTLEIPETSITLQDQTIKKVLQGVPPTTPVKTGTPAAPLGGATPGKPAMAVGSNTGALTPGASAAAPAAPPAIPATAVPLWQFQDQLRADPRWQQTDNARSTAYSLVHQLGTDWGFAS